jgi:TctA family transporter
MIDAWSGAMVTLGSAEYWVAILITMLLVIAVSIIPGVSSIVVMAIIIPFIVLQIEDPIIGIVMLATLGGVNNTLDAIPAILFGLPSAATQVTFLEGHQLARQGLAAHTLGGVYAASAGGGVVGAIALLLVIPVIKPYVLSFSFAEVAAITTFGVAMVAVLSRGAVVKGLIAACGGLLLGTVGLDTFTGVERYTLGLVQLELGLPLIGTTVGFLALPELIDQAVTRRSVAQDVVINKVSTREVLRGARDALSRPWIIIRHSLLAVGLGAIPGVGSGVIDWLSYGFGISRSKDKSQFGKGSFEGVLFAEAAQNAKEGGQAIPTLTLGVPGGLGWVFVLTAMIVYGIAPGPQILNQHADLVMVIVITLALGNVIIGLIGLAITGQLAKLTNIPFPAIAAIIIPIAVISAYLVQLESIVFPVVIVFAFVGLTMKWFSWPRPPLILGFILGPIIEENLFSSFSIYGVAGTFFRPLTMILLVLVVASAVLLSFAMNRSGDVVTDADSPGESVTKARSRESWSLATAIRQRIPDRTFRPTWRLEMLMPTSMLILGVFTARDSFGFPDKSQMFPLWISIGLVVFSGIELTRLILRERPKGPADIMDMPMQSRGAEGAKRTGFLVAGLLVIFFGGSMVIGVRWAALLFSILTPILLLEGRARRIATITAPILVGVFLAGMTDYVMAVHWPDSLFSPWLPWGWLLV